MARSARTEARPARATRLKFVVAVSVFPDAVAVANAFVNAVSARCRYSVEGPRNPGESDPSGFCTGITDWQKFSPSRRLA